MGSKRIGVVLVAALVASPVVQAGTLEEWRRDVDAIVRDIRAYHPDPFTKTGELTFSRQAAALIEALPELDHAERVVGLMRLVASLGDGHTTVEIQDRNCALWYPLRLYEFEEGYFVTSAHRSVAELAGAEVLSIAGRPVAEVAAAARSLFAGENELDAKERLYALSNAFLMRGLGYARDDGGLELALRLADGSVVTRVLEARPADDRYPDGVPIFEWHFKGEVYGLPFGTDEEWITAFRGLMASAFRAADPARPPFLQERTRYTRRAMPDDDAYYVQINQTDDSGMVGFLAEALAEVDRQRPRRLILDLRYNFGGDGSTVTAMIHQFIRREADPPWRELYLVTGRKSFSAAIMAIDALRDHTLVTIVGEPAGAALNSYGDAVSRPYPSLGLDLEVSTLRHQLGSSDDVRPIIPVDVPAPMSFADWAAGRDPAVDPILAGEEMRSIPLIARADGGEVARRAYRGRAARFADLSWWSPPEEIALRRACDDLVAAERFEDALETCRLNTEIHPFVWNTWYNLAAAQRAAGRMAERLRSYRCVVELAPTNWNVPGILALFEREGVEPDLPAGCPVGQ